MAKLSSRRLARAMVELLETHELSEVATAAAEVMAAGGGRPHVEQLLPELERELARRYGHVVVHATTARTLPTALLEQLSSELTRQLGGSSHELQAEIDTSLVGGARLTTADVSLDLSLAAQLQTLRTTHG